MTSTPPLGEHDLTYIQMALQRLADAYESQGETDAATRARSLAQRFEGQPPATGMSPERQAQYQKRVLQTMNQDVAALSTVLEEWYAEMLELDPKAPRRIAEFLVKQIQISGSHASLKILHQAGTKLEALETRYGTSTALQHFGDWIVDGFGRIKDGKIPWEGDPDLTP
jgi:hypothetical protein